MHVCVYIYIYIYIHIGLFLRDSTGQILVMLKTVLQHHNEMCSMDIFACMYVCIGNVKIQLTMSENINSCFT
jgi:hypothetical protein